LVFLAISAKVNDGSIVDSVPLSLILV
jgi:hypothetical protein